MFGPLGGPELVLILVLALIVFGPRRLPEIGKSMGRLLSEFRKASHDFQRTIEDEVEAEKYKAAAPEAPEAPVDATDPQAPAEATVGREDPPPPIEPK
jgi:TatA/E family protein of Tat protein translocase